jgi:putative two-component system response regulator
VAMRGARVLVVDDQEANRLLVREALEPFGLRITEAGDGEEALASIAENVPDIILCDVVMPKRDGYAVCRALKSDPKTRLVPIIMLTSLDQLPDKLQALELGADDYLTKPFNVVELTTRVRSLLSLKHFTDELEHASRVLESIALVVESRDRYTGDHCRRLGRYGRLVGQAMGLGEQDLRSLWLAGTFHDLGKIAVSDAVLNKPDRLTPDELAIMRTHPVIGSDLCRSMRSMDSVVPLIRHHHERLDGSGYPDGLKGSEIPLAVRILTVVDVYDALATRRPYREALPHAKCMEIMREEVRRGWWDADVLETLDRCLRSS